jgi:hypothetical protein
MTTHTADRILHALFCLSRDTRHIDATSLGQAIGCSATQAAQALVQLEKQGLVNATRARLTLPGLARAAQMQAKHGGGGGGHGLPTIGLREIPRSVRRAPLAAANETQHPQLTAAPARANANANASQYAAEATL